LHEIVWVKQILQGDQRAGERLIRQHYPRIYRLLRYLTGNVEIAQDLTQQTFVKAWLALETYKGEARLATWLHRIAYHEYTHWLRSRREDTPLEAVAELADLGLAHELDGILLARALGQLSPELRDTFLLYYVQELSVPEVALVLNLPPGTVKSRLFTARQRLRELLQEPPEGDSIQSLNPTPQSLPNKEGLSHELSAFASRSPAR